MNAEPKTPKTVVVLADRVSDIVWDAWHARRNFLSEGYDQTTKGAQSARQAVLDAYQRGHSDGQKQAQQTVDLGHA